MIHIQGCRAPIQGRYRGSRLWCARCAASAKRPRRPRWPRPRRATPRAAGAAAPPVRAPGPCRVGRAGESVIFSQYDSPRLELYLAHSSHMVSRGLQPTYLHARHNRTHTQVTHWGWGTYTATRDSPRSLSTHIHQHNLRKRPVVALHRGKGQPSPHEPHTRGKGDSPPRSPHPCWVVTRTQRSRRLRSARSAIRFQGRDSELSDCGSCPPGRAPSHRTQCTSRRP